MSVTAIKEKYLDDVVNAMWDNEEQEKGYLITELICPRIQV